MRTAPRLLAIAAVSLLALTGCVKIEMNLTLSEDDTVSGEYIVALTKDSAETLGTDGLDELLATEDIEGATAEPYDDGEYVGTRTTFESVELTEVSDETMTITREGDKFIVTGAPVNAGEELGLDEAPEGAVATMSVTFPGEVTEHNGTLEGNTVTWNLLDAPETIEARGGASAGGGFPLVLLLVLLAIVGVGIGVAGVLITSTRRKGPRTEAAADAEAAAAELTHPDNEADAPAEPVVQDAPVAEDQPVVEDEPVVEAEVEADATTDEGEQPKP
ncbi:LppM family (lipo)protein [Demequina sp.]|uniref:LppM family (lipo)protein n=1 Tax=Demequina sp. TaxID=2050685 RepID=UPI003A8C6237